jgi:tetratricopeptide (TPR) repeat protein
MEEEAVDAAEKLVETDKNSAWGWFALAGALNWAGERGNEALEASEKALSLQPMHPDIIWMRAETLLRQDKHDEAINFIDEYRTKVQNPAELLATKGNTLYQLSRSLKDQTKFDQALITWEEARKIDSSNVSAHHVPGYYMIFSNRQDEAYPLLKKALTLAPDSTAVHQAFWRAILGSRNKNAEKKQEEIESDIASFLMKRGDYPEALFAVSNIYRDLKLNEKRRAIEDKVLKNFSESRATEWILVNRYREFRRKHGKDGFDDPEKLNQYRQMLNDFIQRPHFHRKSLLGDAYRNLFQSIKDDDAVSADKLLEVVQGMVEYEDINPHTVFGLGARALAERKAHFREAEKIARAGISEGKKKIDSQRRIYKTEGDYEGALNWMTGLMYDALGWVYFHEGRLDDAERELRHSYNLNPKNSDNLHHLGQLFEVRGDVEKAETFYVKGVSIQTPAENPSKEALESLYKKRHGNLDGFEKYMDEIKDRDRENRKKEILKAQISEPEQVESFKLKSLDGSDVSLESLKGKIVVLNYWGIWCYWCVLEMPDFQKLQEKYRDDPNVVILTINNDSNPDDVPPWMKEKGYDYTVLLDDGYVSNKAKVTSFPTTWFLDGQGRKAFIKIGWSEKLLEEFSWRIEALKKNRDNR